MAEVVKGAGAPKKKEKGPKKTHNLDDLRRKLGPYVKGITDAYDAMEEDHGSHVLTISDKFNKAAESTGFPVSLLRREISRIRRNIKDEKREQELKPDERQEIEQFRAAMDGLPMGKYAAGQLAKGKA